MNETVKICETCKGPVTADTAGVWCDMPMFGDLPVFCKTCWNKEIDAINKPAEDQTLALDFQGVK